MKWGLLRVTNGETAPMQASAVKLNGLQAKLSFAGRKIHAWWEGYAFDEAAERAALAARCSDGANFNGQAPEDLIAEAIWGAGRLEPGEPAWTMRFARMLSLPVKANVLVLGAGAGAPLNDLRHGTRWKASGLTRTPKASSHDLRNYDEALQRLQKASSAGALSFFEMHRDPDPVAFAQLSAELLLPGAKAVFVDFAVARKGVRLRSCFPSSTKGTPRPDEEYQRALTSAGFTVTGTSDETKIFLPLIAQGWAGWQSAYSAITQIQDVRLRASLTRALGVHAHLWAERYDALKSGQLRVMRYQAVKD